MKAKSLAVQLLTALILVIGAYSNMLPASVAAWLGIVSMAATLILNQWFSTGTIVKGWTWVMWATNIAGIVLQLMAAIGDNGLLAANVTNGIIIAINIFMQAFLKDYTGAGSVVEKKLV